VRVTFELPFQVAHLHARLRENRLDGIPIDQANREPLVNFAQYRLALNQRGLRVPHLIGRERGQTQTQLDFQFPLTRAVELRQAKIGMPILFSESI